MNDQQYIKAKFQLENLAKIKNDDFIELVIHVFVQEIERRKKYEI